jgi:membrane dipeptidase
MRRQVVFVPKFTDADEENATLEQVADHIEYIGKGCGKAHVGISSDFGKLPPLLPFSYD